MKNSSKFNLLLNPRMKAITISFICLFFILNSSVANNGDGKKEFGAEVEFTLVKVIKNENTNIKSTSTNPVENFNKKNTLIKIPFYSQSHLLSNEKSSFTPVQSISKTNGSWNSFPRETSSSTSSTNGNQKDNLELRSSLNRYFAFGFLVGKKKSAAIVSNVIYTQSEKIGKMKFKAKLKSVSLTVFF